MNTTPTLDPARRARLRTFLTAEAASQPVDPPRRVGLHSRRLATGAAAALMLGSVLAISTLRPDGTDTALAITTQGAWTTVRLPDVDADPQTVVDELVAAGIDARIAPGWPPTPPAQGDGSLTFAIFDDQTFAYGLSILVPGDPTDGPQPTDQPPPFDPERPRAVPSAPVTDDVLEQHGVRINPQDDQNQGLSFSIRSGSDATILVHPRD